MSDEYKDQRRSVVTLGDVNWAHKRIKELEAKLELIQAHWAGAVYGDLENGVARLNVAAATDFYKRYPLVASFGETLNRIVDGE